MLNLNQNQIKSIEKLLDLKSKHSQYQILPHFITQNISIRDKTINRYEQERLKLILSLIDFDGKSIVDIGGNSGYFSLELSDKFPDSSLTLVEGNRNHAEFVKSIAKIANLKIRVVESYYEFNSGMSDIFPSDITILFNVLHHIGDDFGDQKIRIGDAKKQIINALNALADKTKILILQIGYNWKGNIKLPLFEHGTKQEQIDFITNGSSKYWHIDHISIAESSNNKILYKDADESNLSRDDSLGEFGNRPIFILKSKIITQA